MPAVERRRGRGMAANTVKVLDAAIKLAKEIQPCTVRALCYGLFVRGLIESMAKKNTDKISKLLVQAREKGSLPWGWIVDETREAERISTWDSPDQIIDAAVRGYRKDYWSMQPAWVEVWSEKGTVRGTLAPVLKKYGVTFRVMHGYGSATSLYSIAQETVDSDKKLTVLYIGDWDPSGMQMSEIDLPDRLGRYGGDANIIRVALNQHDVGAGTELPFFEAETKGKDPRYEWFVKNYGRRCWEVDALSPVVLRQRVEHRIRSRLDLDAWNHAITVEKAETDSMKEFMGTWKSISGQAKKYSPGEGGAHE